jgi:hypothetical protein
MLGLRCGQVFASNTVTLSNRATWRGNECRSDQRGGKGSLEAAAFADRAGDVRSSGRLARSQTCSPRPSRQNVGSKQTGGGQGLIQLENGKWMRKTPYPYSCGPVISSGVGE